MANRDNLYKELVAYLESAGDDMAQVAKIAKSLNDTVNNISYEAGRYNFQGASDAVNTLRSNLQALKSIRGNLNAADYTPEKLKEVKRTTLEKIGIRIVSVAEKLDRAIDEHGDYRSGTAFPATANDFKTVKSYEEMASLLDKEIAALGKKISWGESVIGKRKNDFAENQRKTDETCQKMDAVKNKITGAFKPHTAKPHTESVQLSIYESEASGRISSDEREMLLDLI